MILTIILAAIILGLVYLVFRPMDYWKKRGIPHEDPVPIFGNMASILFKRRNFVDKLTDLYQKFYNERYFGFYQSSSPVLIIKDPDLIKQIAIKDFDAFTDHTSQAALEHERILKKSLIFLDGKEWQDMRGTLSPAFTSAKMKNMLPMIQECNDTFIKYLKKNCKNGQVDMQLSKIFTKFMIDVIGNTSFAVRTNALEDSESDFIKAARSFRGDSWVQNIKIILALAAPWLFKALGLRLFSDDYIHNMLHDTIKMRQQQNIVRQDVVHLLNEAKNGRLRHEAAIESSKDNTGFATAQESDIDKADKNRKKILDDDDLTAQALLFFIAGFATSSVAISFAIFELARNPEIQKRLREEVDAVLEKDGGKVTYDSLLKMKYLDQVISETLRKWPPVPRNDRVCTKDFTIEPEDPKDPKERSLTVSRGISVFFPTYQLHHDPKYFPNPEKFDPERFSDENKHKINTSAYIPFGIGPRNCIGSRFALINIKCVVFNLVANFEIVPNEKTDLEFKISPSRIDVSTEENQVTFKARF